MKRLLTLVATLSAATALAQTSKPFTLQQALNAPYATNLTAAPVGNLFAWVEDEEGRHNLYIGGKDVAARALTHNTEDDAQDISQIAWSPDAKSIAYTYGAPGGADGRPANPAHLQRPTPVRVMLTGTGSHATVVTIGEGRSPLFTRDGKGLLFLRDGQIWLTCLSNCHPDLERSEREGERPASQTTPALLARQLVYDRGSASSLTLSPNGNTLAFISRRREFNEPSHTLLALYNFATHALTFPTPSTGNDSAPAFSPDGKQLAWIRNPFTDIPEFANPRTSATPWSIQLLDLIACTTPDLCHPDPELAEGEGPASPASSRTLYTHSDHCHPERSEGPASPGCSRTLYTPEPNQPGSVLPDLATGSPYLLWAADHRIVFYSEADGWLHLYAIHANANEAPKLLTPGDFEIEDASIDAAHRILSWASNDARAGVMDHDRLHIWQLNTSDPGEAPKYRTLGDGIETHPVISGDALGTLAANTHTPMFPAVIGLEGQIQALNPATRDTRSAQASFAAPQQVLFDSVDGLHLHGQLFLPKQKAGPSAAPQDDNGGRARQENRAIKHPALIFVHGGPKRQMLLGYPGMEYYSNAYAMNQYFASRGFIVLSVNYRCGIGYGLEFRACQNAGATGATEYNDVLAAQRYLASRNDVNVKRIGIWGGSYGGYLTALALARNSDLFAAGVDFHGVHDWNLEDNASDWKRGSFGQQDAIAAKALKSSPLADLSQWRSPILLIHGDNDPEVAYAQTPLLADALRGRNASLPKDQQVDIEELVFPDEVHEFALHKDWLAAYEAAAAFFERTLKP